jgi:hypothetical protein
MLLSDRMLEYPSDYAIDNEPVAPGALTEHSIYAYSVIMGSTTEPGAFAHSPIVKAMKVDSFVCKQEI